MNAITGYKVIPGAMADIAHLRQYLSTLSYHRITEHGTARCDVWKALEGAEAFGREAKHVLDCCDRAGFQSYLSYNGLVIIRYTSASDWIGWHVDRQDVGRGEIEVGSFSMGAERVMEFRKIGGDEAEASLALRDNELVVMESGFQSRYEHRIPPASRDGERYSVVLFTRQGIKP